MNTVISVRANEHRYFLSVSVILTALVIWAFSFEYQDLIHPSRFSLLVLVHGLVMFTWVGLFLTQVTFVVWHRPLWHHRLGVIGTAVAVLVVALGVPSAIVACRLGARHVPGTRLRAMLRAFRASWPRAFHFPGRISACGAYARLSGPSERQTASPAQPRSETLGFLPSKVASSSPRRIPSSRHHCGWRRVRGFHQAGAPWTRSCE